MPKQSKKKKGVAAPRLESLTQLNANAAGIDEGARELYVCVPEDRGPNPVRVFETFPFDLREIAAWLKSCGVTSVAMESTGIYGIPLYEVLEEAGFEVKLANARQIKNLPGRKSDILDCQWIQQPHSYGLLTAPEGRVRKTVLRDRVSFAIQNLKIEVVHFHLLDVPAALS